ncbi:hypothetical protein [Serratia fonticola]
MKLEDDQINSDVRNGLGDFTNGVLFRDSKVFITLNLPDGQKYSIEGEWRHMSDSIKLSERIKMLQHAIYERYSGYGANIPGNWAR